MCENVVNLGLWPWLTTFPHISSGFNKSVINLKLGCQLILYSGHDNNLMVVFTLIFWKEILLINCF